MGAVTILTAVACFRRGWVALFPFACGPLAGGPFSPTIRVSRLLPFWLLLDFPVPFRWCSKYPGAINQLIYCRSPGQYKFQYGRTMGQTALSLIDAHPAAPVQLCVLFAASPASRGAPLQLPLSARAVFRIIGS